MTMPTQFAKVVPVDEDLTYLWTVTIADGFLCKIWSLTNDQVDLLSESNAYRPDFLDNPLHAAVFADAADAKNFFGVEGDQLVDASAEQFMQHILESVQLTSPTQRT